MAASPRNGHSDGAQSHQYDPALTDSVIAATGPNASARLKQVMPALIRHVHDFAREVDLTTEEYMAGVAMINWAGQMSTDRRNEGQLLTDVIGLESLVDEITHKLAASSAISATSSAILGPFWRETLLRNNGETIFHATPSGGQVAYVFGQVKDVATGKPLANTTVDVWQASTNGLYEQQDPSQPDHNLRGKFLTDSNGGYAFYCLRPTPYPVPGDGPAGKLLDLLDRHHYRPGHIHFMVVAKDYRSVTTQIFDKDSPYLSNDSVFAVKSGLSVEFTPRKGDPQALWQLEYDITLAALS